MGRSLKMGCTLCADLPDEVVDQTLDDFLNGDEAKAFKDEFNEFEHNNAAAEQWDDELEADDELSNHRKKSIISGNAFKPPPKALKPESIKQWLLAVSCCYEHYDKKVPQPSSLLCYQAWASFVSQVLTETIFRRRNSAQKPSVDMGPPGIST